MLKKLIARNFKRYIALYAVFSIVLAIASVAYAEYTRTSRGMRVVAAYEPIGSLFSSNYLARDKSENGVESNWPEYRRTIYTSSLETSAAANVTICSYAQGNPTRTYPGGIDYDLTVTVMKYADRTLTAAAASDLGSNIIIIQDVELSASRLSYTFSGQHTEPMDIYAVEIPSALADSGICLLLQAVPIGEYDDIEPLKGFFDCALMAEEPEQLWNGVFAANELEAPGLYDGYNYTLSGNGAGTLTVSWADSNLTPNKYDSIFGGADVSGTSYTLHVDSAMTDRYVIRFYRTGTTPDLSKVKVSFTPDEE